MGLYLDQAASLPRVVQLRLYRDPNQELSVKRLLRRAIRTPAMRPTLLVGRPCNKLAPTGRRVPSQPLPRIVGLANARSSIVVKTFAVLLDRWFPMQLDILGIDECPKGGDVADTTPTIRMQVIQEDLSVPR